MELKALNSIDTNWC